MEEAKQLFKKLKIYSLLDLALIVPASYNDTTLSTTLEIGKVHTLEAKVIESSVYGGKLRVTFLLTQSGRRLSSTFFRVTSYHHKLFEAGSSHVIQGRLDEYKGYLQMPQPKSIKQIGKITPKYKTVLKESEIASLMEVYITEKNFFDEGLDSKEVATLMRVHFPKKMDEVYENGNFKPEIVEVLKFVEAYNHLRKLRGKRTDFPALRALNGSIEPFVSNLPFKLTKEQQSVIAQIQQDLSREDKAAKRMVVGDVGSGKTMVILASAMMALPHKSILMAPTSLLALQLYEEACKHLPKNVKIALVMQGKAEGTYKEADFIIGTHALLFKEDLPEASLVMVDEQHRFGTKQRQSLEALVSPGERKPHYLQFSATPIPRTQAMMESELLDVSLITTTPFEREVLTQTVGREDFPDLLNHIKEEIAQKHQVLIVYPLVEESSEVPYQSLDESREFWEERFENVYVTHGKDKQKEKVLLDFREKGNILLATTVVEVGISLPRLTLIVIVGAERLGLATLHQLRGRVGRNGLKSWCYLFSNNAENFRLEQFAQTTNGFDIAKLDLKFRDSGDILDGTIQSGQRFKWLDMAEDESVVAYAKMRIKNVEKS
ncbi:ATP-dependent DNA helicase RecG [Sulfurovum sp.]|uniref:ATP-dependent DNA helicase RecG n=1 Tax=Sulfurovum sp. TaxID=1969726 RepID=UPI0025D44F19|nr:ATP-dependent DNA helicase RecG [Sulfurovum sp.]